MRSVKCDAIRSTYINEQLQSGSRLSAAPIVITAPVDVREPFNYRRINYADATLCGRCHRFFPFS